MDKVRFAKLDALLWSGESSWPLLLPGCGLFPKRFGGTSGPIAPGPNNCSSAGGGNAGGGVGEKDDVAGVIITGPVVVLGIREAPKNDVSSGVMAKSAGSLDVELLALRLLAGPEAKDGEAGRERCKAASVDGDCSAGIAEIETGSVELRLTACKSKLGDDANDGPDLISAWGSGSSRGPSIAFCTPSAGL
jgi:hypothetical protein